MIAVKKKYLGELLVHKTVSGLPEGTRHHLLQTSC
ncbi:unnamed protein product [Acanthoscelides obtectus]|uniref:Uncharacterized protein n=1 Tax=Acanthoscelides obtectus TaxID=200917 RepID=A0A9P0LJT9_ACAOB|nr:unnamed protein product [Acanthoscelides obtectus]CAK1633623.1 hypothetical protein AOBTE_LOCUS8266 [Acanthoscelides obtectus]